MLPKLTRLGRLPCLLRHGIDIDTEEPRRRQRVQVLAIPIRLRHPPVAGDLRRDPQLDLAEVAFDQYPARLGREAPPVGRVARTCWRFGPLQLIRPSSPGTGSRSRTRGRPSACSGHPLAAVGAGPLRRLAVIQKQPR